MHTYNETTGMNKEKCIEHANVTRSLLLLGTEGLLSSLGGLTSLSVRLLDTLDDTDSNGLSVKADQQGFLKRTITKMGNKVFTSCHEQPR